MNGAAEGAVVMDAWAGNEPRPVEGKMSAGLRWALRGTIEATPSFLAPPVVNLRDWSHPEVGWGLVLAEGAPIPPELERLRKHRRNAPVFRYRPASKYRYAVLRNYEAQKDVDINASPRGTGGDALPYYLLIYGSPKVVPWRLQYVLNTNRCVGRLDLEGEALRNYVTAIIERWESSSAAGTGRRAPASLLWSVAHAGGEKPDITQLMRDAIALPLHSRLTEDTDTKDETVLLEGDAATAESLSATIAQRRPAYIVTTSHGQTGPLGEPKQMTDRLGVLVDQLYGTVREADLASRAHPDGAIWYAHACCSAGSDAESSFAELFSEDTPAGQVLREVAALGSLTAPLPRALLGAEQPIRAFVGHVEPTFDWTLRQRFTGQFLTSSLVQALYNQIYSTEQGATPVGHCFREWFALTGGLLMKLNEARAAFNRGESTDDLILWCQLAARDVASTVILGDPALPLPPA